MRVMRVPGRTLAKVGAFTALSLGADTGVGDLDAVIKANFLCNDLGMDPISAGATIAAAMEMFETGVLTEEQAQCHDEAAVSGVADGRPVAHGQFFALRYPACWASASLPKVTRDVGCIPA